MRHYQSLDHVQIDPVNNTLLIDSSAEAPGLTSVWFGREGLYVSVSASYGPVELALRPRQHDLVTSLSQLRPTERLSVMRMVGTGQAHLGLGLSTNGELLLRAAIVADATGHCALNLVLSAEARRQLFTWLGVENDSVA